MSTQTKTRRGYSTEFEDHRGLIANFAVRGMMRLQRAGVTLDFDDVFQEMSVIYCRAAAKYNPEAGFTFTAYLGRAIWLDFNKVAERLINEQLGLGLVRVEELGDADCDAYDLLKSNAQTPEEHYIANRAFVDGMRALPIRERKVVGEFVMGEMPGADKCRSLASVMREMHMSKGEMAKSRQAIFSAFGIGQEGDE